MDDQHTYVLNLFTQREDFFRIEISFKDLDMTTYRMGLLPLHDQKMNYIFNHRQNAYQLALQSPIPLSPSSIEKIYKEIKQNVKDIYEIKPRFIDVVSLSQFDGTFSDCYKMYNNNILCSNYRFPQIEDVTNQDFIDTTHIKRLDYTGPLVQLNPEQEVFRLSDIRYKDTFPNVHCVRKNGVIHILENTLDHKTYEKTVYVIHDDYIALTPHAGFIQTHDNLFVWFVSIHILVPNLAERRTAFDPDIKHVSKINTSVVLERFQEILQTLNFVTASIIHNKSIYSFETGTLVFIGHFPGDAVTTKIRENYLACLKNESIPD